MENDNGLMLFGVSYDAPVAEEKLQLLKKRMTSCVKGNSKRKQNKEVLVGLPEKKEQVRRTRKTSTVHADTMENVVHRARSSSLVITTNDKTPGTNQSQESENSFACYDVQPEMENDQDLKPDTMLPVKVEKVDKMHSPQPSMTYDEWDDSFKTELFALCDRVAPGI